MSDEVGSDKIAALTQKIEREMRFTRSLVLLCTGAILGIILLNIKYTLLDLPNDRIVPALMENMPIFHAQWTLLEKTAEKRLGVPSMTDDRKRAAEAAAKDAAGKADGK